MIVYIVRHAQTEANIHSIIQGQSDTEITVEGMTMAKAMSRYFSDKNITKIYSSPIKRAFITACLIADVCQITVENIALDDRLMEINLKPWAYKKIDDLDSSDSRSSYKTYKFKPSKFQPLSGESLFDVKERMSKTFEWIIQGCCNDDNIVIVSHSVAIRTLLTYFEKKTIDHIWSYNIPPVSVTEVNLSNDGLSVVEIGAIIH